MIKKKETANDSYKDLEKTSRLISQPNTLKGGEGVSWDAKIFLGIVAGIAIIIIASVYFLKSKSKKSQ